MDKPRVGILTTFYEFDPAYSLCAVVHSQLVPLVKYGYRPVLFVHDNFKDDRAVPDGVEIRKVVPRFLLGDYTDNTDVPQEVYDQADKVLEALREHTKDIDIMIEHDLIFQGWFMPYCIAIHKFAQESKIKWLHWTHSYPNRAENLKPPHELRHSLPANSRLVYLNNHDIVRAAEAYNTMPKNVRIVHNALDPRLFDKLHPLVENLIDRYDLLSADFVQVYPLSTPRMVAGKGIHTVIEVMAGLKREGKSVRLIVCNAHANAKREWDTIAQTVTFANQHGLNSSEVIFTSLEERPEYEKGVPREVVSQLFRLSNVFIFPTTSENCSLILLEAMLSGNILILNEDVPSLREFGKENALYFKFGSIHWNVDYSDREQYMSDVAKHIISEMSINRPFRAKAEAKKRFNYDFIFKTQIEPLFYES